MELSRKILEAVESKKYVTNYNVNLALSLSSKGAIQLQQEVNTGVFAAFKYNGYSEFAGLPIYENELQEEEFIIIKKL